MSRKHKRTTTPKPFVSNPYNQGLIAAHHDAVAAAPWLAGVATPEPAAAPSPRLRVLCVLDDVEADHKVLDHFEDEAARLEDSAADADADGRNAEAHGLYDQADVAKRRRAIAEMQLRARLVFANLPSLIVDVTDKDSGIDDVHGEVKVNGQWVKVADYDLVFLDNEWSACRYLAAGLPPSRVAFVANVKAERRDGRRHVIPATLAALLRRIGDLVADRRRQLLLPWGFEQTYPPAPSSDDAAVDEAIVRFARA